GRHKDLIPLCLMTGAVLGISCDLISRVPGSSLTLPLNAVTSMLGAPVIIYIILRGRRVFS
ncbi:MAG: iron chelate uptake ABC transporter family permease subunit, partial [Flavobacteriales bacterium]|nr:iron chelate uptake ABC transporter family permease subunit [Flavobacteriales bacterium]